MLHVGLQNRGPLILCLLDVVGGLLIGVPDLAELLQALVRHAERGDALIGGIGVVGQPRTVVMPDVQSRRVMQVWVDHGRLDVRTLRVESFSLLVLHVVLGVVVGLTEAERGDALGNGVGEVVGPSQFDLRLVLVFREYRHGHLTCILSVIH